MNFMKKFFAYLKRIFLDDATTASQIISEKSTYDKTNSEISASADEELVNKISKSLYAAKEKICEYEKCNDMPDDFIVLDIETTGFSPLDEHIIQISAVKYENNIKTNEFSEYIKPPIPIPNEITNLTGIDDEKVSDCRNIKSVFEDMIIFLGNDYIICHNAPFDIPFIQTKLNFNGFNILKNKVIDTLPLSRKYIKDVENHKLATLKEYLNLDYKSHDALYDCYTTAELYLYCKQKSKTDLKNHNSDCSDTESPKPELSELEKEYFSTVKKLLEKNNKNTDILAYSKNSTYFDINVENYPFLRFKTTGKIKYWLIHYDIENFRVKYSNNVVIEPGNKSEGIMKKRVYLTSPNELQKFDEYILKLYNSALESKNRYDEWVANGKPTHYSVTLKFDKNGIPYCEKEAY